MRSTRRGPRRLERILVWVLAGFIAVDLLLIVPAFASELRLDRLHPSLPIVNLRSLAAVRARIADGLGEELAAPVRALAGELEQAGVKAINAAYNGGGATFGNPSGPIQAPTTPNDQNSSKAGIIADPSAVPTPVPDTDPEDAVEPTPAPPTLYPSPTLTVASTNTQTPFPANTDRPTQSPSIAPSQTPTHTEPPLSPTPVQDGIFYVATNGNDSNPGKEARPFRTISRGLSVLSPGDTLYVRNGTYRESLTYFPSGESWGNPVKLLAYPGDTVVIKPNSGSQVLLFTYSHHVIVDGFVLDGANVESDVIKITAGAHHIRIQNAEVKGAPSQGILTTNNGSVSSDYNEFINLNVHHNGTSDFDHGMYISTSHNLIDRSSIHHNAGWGISIYEEGCNNCANHNVVSNSAIYDNARVGDRGPGIILSSGSGNLAYNNLVWGNYGGIQVAYGVSDAKVYNNVIYANDNYGIKIQSDSANAIIRNNIIYQNGGAAISDAGSRTVQDHNLIEADPHFVNVSGHDFRLQAGSPGIDTGIALSAVTHDYDGISRPRGASYDIGAFESP